MRPASGDVLIAATVLVLFVCFTPPAHARPRVDTGDGVGMGAVAYFGGPPGPALNPFGGISGLFVVPPLPYPYNSSSPDFYTFTLQLDFTIVNGLGPMTMTFEVYPYTFGWAATIDMLVKGGGDGGSPIPVQSGDTLNFTMNYCWQDACSSSLYGAGWYGTIHNQTGALVYEMVPESLEMYTQSASVWAGWSGTSCMAMPKTGTASFSAIQMWDGNGVALPFDFVVNDPPSCNGAIRINNATETITATWTL